MNRAGRRQLHQTVSTKLPDGKFQQTVGLPGRLLVYQSPELSQSPLTWAFSEVPGSRFLLTCAGW